MLKMRRRWSRRRLPHKTVGTSAVRRTRMKRKMLSSALWKKRKRRTRKKFSG
jgi:hypothetical protein